MSGPGSSRRPPLDAFFHPSSVALVGASERPDSIGRRLMWNLVSNPFGGTVYPVHPARTSVLGVRAFASVSMLPETPDLAVIATPAAAVPDVLEECAVAGVRAAIVVSAGFKEVDEAGAARERRIGDIARAYGMRVLGPNSLGVISPVSGLDASIATTMATPGTLAFLSQSGALGAAVLDWSQQQHVGFSALVSMGAMTDVGWNDLIDYFGRDSRTRSIVLYMESIGDARGFMSAAREVALEKPIIVIKAGRTAPTQAASISHTGALAGDDDVLDTAFRRCGVLRVDSIAELFYMAEVLAKQPRPSGPRLAIVTNAGGPGILAADALLANGGELAQLSDATLSKLDGLLPAHWGRANPVNLLRDASPERYTTAVDVVAKDPGVNGLLVILTPQAATDARETAARLEPWAKVPGKPVLASWMGGAEVAPGEATLNRLDVPTFPYPDTAARLFTLMWRHTTALRALYETPILPAGLDDAGAASVQAIISEARAAKRTLLTEAESKTILAAYDIPVSETVVVASAEEAVRAAERIGFPVVLKVHSSAVPHKALAGGVVRNVGSAREVAEGFAAIERSTTSVAGADAFEGVTVQPMVRQDGYELIVGSALDPQFGPVLAFGAGGSLVEVYRDRALGLPPLTTTLALRMMERTRIARALGGAGGVRVDREALAELLVRFSRLVCEHPAIREIEVNPLFASAEGLLALDARAVLHGSDAELALRPRPAVTPYPTRYVSEHVCRKGRRVTIRPIRPEDEPLMKRFHETLSDRSVYFRYFHMMKLGQRVAHDRLSRICFIDYDRDMALVVEEDTADGPDIAAVGRLTRIRGTNCSEFAILVADAHQGRGLGTELLGRLVTVGRDQGVDRIVADILSENRDMQHVSERVGFKCRYDQEDGVVKAELDLKDA